MAVHARPLGLTVHSSRRTAGFTIVEMLVVIGIITLLLGLLLPALSGARNRARKADEINGIREIGIAWGLYANNYDGAALPGYLEPEVQKLWRVSYDDSLGKDLLPAPDYNPGDPNIAGPWTWRLLPYLDYNHTIVHGYLGEADESVFGLAEEAEEVAMTPAFGYNAYYLGGWQELHTFTNPNTGDEQQVARARYADATAVGSSVPVTPVARAISNVQRSSEVVAFCSSALLEPGFYKSANTRDNEEGCHYVSPPILANQLKWGPATAGAQQGSGGISQAPGGGARFSTGGGTIPLAIEVFGNGGLEPAPIARYTGKAALLYVDGHTDAQLPSALLDQRKWIDVATSLEWTHE